jgi:hypothetical protein
MSSNKRVLALAVSASAAIVPATSMAEVTGNIGETAGDWALTFGIKKTIGIGEQ